VEKNSSFANFGRALACAICKCAVLCVGGFHFLVFLQQNTAVVGFSSLVPNGWRYVFVADFGALSYQVTTTFDTSCTV
jgi:hypothetical protein